MTFPIGTHRFTEIDDLESAEDRDMMSRGVERFKHDAMISLANINALGEGYPPLVLKGGTLDGAMQLLPFRNNDDPTIKTYEYELEEFVKEIRPQHLLRECLTRAIREYNGIIEDACIKLLQAYEDLKFRQRYEVTVHQLEWHEYRVEIDADDVDDLEAQITDAVDVDAFICATHQGSSSCTPEHVPERLQGVHLDGDIDEAIEDSNPCD